MEFTGTKGKWLIDEEETHTNRAGVVVYVISSDKIDKEMADVYGSKSNALLISKAPEMLEMLKDILWAVENSNIEADVISIENLERLIKEATEL